MGLSFVYISMITNGINSHIFMRSTKDKNLHFQLLTAVLSGELPINKTRLVQAWIEIHRESLLANWELAISGQTPFKIEPLR